MIGEGTGTERTRGDGHTSSLEVLRQISNDLTNLTSTTTNEGIVVALQRLADLVGADRCLLFDSSDDGRLTHCTHEWHAAGLDPVMARLRLWKWSEFPLAVDPNDGGCHLWPTPEGGQSDGTTEAERWLEVIGPGSTMTVPLQSNGTHSGMLVVQSSHSDTSWAPETEYLVKLTGDVMLLAIEKRRSRKALHASELNLTTLFECIDDFLLIFDTAGRVLHFSTLVIRRLGFPQAELRRMTLAELFGLSRAAGERDTLNRLLQGSGSTHVLGLERRNGGPISVEAKMTLGLWNGQQVLYATCRDITERRLAAEGLQRSEARTSAILDAIPDAILRLGRSGSILDFTPGDLATDLNLNDGQSWAFARELASLCDGAVRRAFESGENEVTQVEVTTESEDVITFEVRVRAMGDDEVLAIVRDVSRQARLEQMKSDFINRASHELRTPLTTALLMAELIHEGGEKDEIEEYWDILNLELKRQHELVEDLLTAGQLETGRHQVHLVPLNLKDVVNRAVTDLTRLADARRIQLVSTVAEDIPLINGDHSALQRILVNLIDNAVKFTPTGGTVTVDAELADEGVRVRIIDTGIGIPKEELAKLFDRFFRASNAVKAEIRGTGVGLFIVKSLMEAHGGSVTVDSGIDQGTTFTLWLPIPDEGAESE